VGWGFESPRRLHENPPPSRIPVSNSLNARNLLYPNTLSPFGPFVPTFGTTWHQKSRLINLLNALGYEGQAGMIMGVFSTEPPPFPQSFHMFSTCRGKWPITYYILRR